MGDLVDGFDIKGRGKGMWTTDINQQISTAASLLSMIRTDKYVGVQGSYYHVGDNVSSDQSVLKELYGVHGDELSLNVDGSRIHASHFVGVSSSGSSYRPTPIAREMMLASINQEEYGKYKLILRGHAHYYVRVSFSNSTGLICPCWTGRDAFVARQTLAFNPHLGYVLVTIHKGEMDIKPSVFTLSAQKMIKEVEI
jgi:hypothetical protein